jgi:hypothetical protein
MTRQDLHGRLTVVLRRRLVSMMVDDVLEQAAKVITSSGRVAVESGDTLVFEARVPVIKIEMTVVSP